MLRSGLRDRREFLRFLAASPLFRGAYCQQRAPALGAAKDALNVLDFEEPARRVLPPAHWGYLATGVDDDFTIQANREAFKHFQLRPRRLVDASHPDLKTELFGVVWETPIFICPVGSQKAFHPQGEVAVARAAKAKQTLLILSTVTSSSVEDVAEALGTPPWYQLYMPSRWDATEKMLKRVEDAGCPVLVWTIDLLAGRNTETLERFRRADTRDCAQCHATARGGSPFDQKPMFRGMERAVNPPGANWDYIDRLRKITKMKLVIKGIDTHEDARLCRERGVDGIIVSNHGGRATETGRGTIEALAEVVEAAGSRIPVLVDGGFRRGTDVFKALALGAKAVGIGRPYIWGLSAFGQGGVERVLDILRAELLLIMRQCGTPTIKQITRSSVTTNARI